MTEPMTLLGQHVRQMDILGAIEGVEDPDDEVRTCRLAMLCHGEDPANDVRVCALLDLPLAEYQDYVDDVLTQIGPAPSQSYRTPARITSPWRPERRPWRGR